MRNHRLKRLSLISFLIMLTLPAVGFGQGKLRGIKGCSPFSGCPRRALRPATIIAGLDAAHTDFSGTFTLAAGGSAGNYVVFPDCHGSSFTPLPVNGASTDGQYRAPVNRIQIISRPWVTISATAKLSASATVNSSTEITVSGSVTSDAGPIVPDGARYVVTDASGSTVAGGPITLEAGGSYSFSLSLSPSPRASRPYNVTIRAGDEAGHLGSATVAVNVP